MDTSWKRMFPSRILERGRNIFESDMVDNIRKTGTGYRATVYGTRDYLVTIDMDGDEVVDMECTCPYAADGTYCKHEAALLFEITYADDYEDLFESAEDEPGETIEDIIDHMSEQQIREELKRIVDQNSDIYRYLMNKYRTKSADASYPDKVYRQLDLLAETYGYRGFIDWRNGGDYVIAFERCLDDMILPMMERKEYMIAFKSLVKAFRVLNEVEMDGSFGEHSDIGDYIRNYWDQLIQYADEKEIEAMHDWFVQMEPEASSWICGDYITDILDNSFEGEQFLLPRIEKVKGELKFQSQSSRYVKELLRKYKSLLIRCQRNLAEYESWLNNHSDFIAVKEILLDEALAREDYSKAIAILEDIIENEENHWNISSYQMKLIELYRKTGNKSKTKQILVKRILGSNNHDLDEIRELKTLCDNEEWAGLREQIALKYPDIQPDIYYEDKMYDQLLKSLMKADDDKLHLYKNKLKNKFPEELLQIYVRRIEDMTSERGSTGLYNRMELCLKNAYDINYNTMVLLELMNRLALLYPTRKAMLKMLDKVKWEISATKKV